jgi:hypothetical protein
MTRSCPPALVLAKRDRESGALTADDEQLVVRVTRDIVDDLVSLHAPQRLNAGDNPLDEATESVRSKVLVFGCPARDEADEVALRMLCQLLDPVGCNFKLLATETLTAEVAARASKERPAVICIAALPPGGLTQTRHLCKRLQGQFPGVKILVGRWGQVENVERLRERLLTDGVDQVVTTLLEARDYLGPLIQALAHMQSVRAAI